MLQNLATFLGRKDRSEGVSRVEAFGQSKISRQQGEELLRATTERRNLLQGIRDRLSSMTREEKDELVDRLFARVALFVFDLPASESDHHSRRFGLLDHLLEVAYHTVREASGPGFTVSPEQSINHREKPLWVYAGMVAAIAHDIGKPLDIDVSVPGAGNCWDPRAEPLRLFCDRHRLSATGPHLWHFHVGRGLRGHEKHIPTLFPIVITAAVREYLGPRLDAVIEAMTTTGEWKLVGGTAHPAQNIVRIVRQVDEKTSREDGPEGKAPPAEPARPPSPKPAALRPVTIPQQQALPFPPAKAEKPPTPTESMSEDEEEPLLVPPDFRPEPVPEMSLRRGDPTEMAQRMKTELDPTRLIDTVRRMIGARRLSRNNLCTEIYIRPDYVWLIVPKALRRMADFAGLPWEMATERAMYRSLRTSPLVVPESPRRVKVFVRPMPHGAPYEAVRILTRGLLSEHELKCVGIYGYELQALDLLPDSVKGK